MAETIPATEDEVIAAKRQEAEKILPQENALEYKRSLVTRTPHEQITAESLMSKRELVPISEHDKDLHEQTNQLAETATETETAGTEGANQTHVDTLQSIVDGQHDSEDLTTLLDMIDKAAQALIDAGVAEQYDDLIGKAAEHWAALDEKASG